MPRKGRSTDVHSIVFIHGLQGHPRDTWTARSTADVKEPGFSVLGLLFRVLLWLFYPMSSCKQASFSRDASQKRPTYWPEDLLPNECEKARIMTFGYDSDVTKFFGGSANQNTFYQHAKALLFALDRYRSKDVRRRV